MIYEYKNHSLYYANRKFDFPLFSLTLKTLELIYNLKSGNLMGAEGFLPLVKAVPTGIQINDSVQGQISLQNFREEDYEEGFVYELFNKAPNLRKYFDDEPIKFDKKKGIILLGTEPKGDEKTVRISPNIICGSDERNCMKCIYLIPDKFV